MSPEDSLYRKCNVNAALKQRKNGYVKSDDEKSLGLGAPCPNFGRKLRLGAKTRKRVLAKPPKMQSPLVQKPQCVASSRNLIKWALRCRWFAMMCSYHHRPKQCPKGPCLVAFCRGRSQLCGPFKHRRICKKSAKNRSIRPVKRHFAV